MLLAGHSIHVMPVEMTAFRIRDGDGNMSAGRSDTKLRAPFEFSRILRRHLELDDGDFESIFGDQAQETVGLPVSRRLAELALRKAHTSHKLFALEVLHATAKSDADFGFLRNATGATDILGIELSQELLNERGHSSRLAQALISVKETNATLTQELRLANQRNQELAEDLRKKSQSFLRRLEKGLRRRLRGRRS
jgi:hypothetical protein